jgi:putative copper export protein
MRGAQHDRSAGWSAAAARAGLWASAILLLDAPVRLYAQARGLVQPGDPVAPMMMNVLRTVWGRGLLVQIIASVVALVGFLVVHRGRARGWDMAVVGCIVLALSPALMGHAIAAEHYLALSLIADWFHVVAAASWLGGVTMLALPARAAASGGDDRDAFATAIELFHPVALAASATLVATGVVSLLLRVEHLADLLHSLYGALLAIKLLLTVAVIAVGYRHATRGAAIVRAQGTSALSRTLAGELLFAVLVIATTAALVGTSPPMSMTMDM